MAELILFHPESWYDGERECATLLQEGLPDHWLLAAHLILPNRDDDRELDLVVVGDGFVHNVEVKHSGGPIRLDARHIRVGGGVVRKSPLAQSGHAARILRSELDDTIDGFAGLDYRVVADRVVFSNPRARLEHVHDKVRTRVSTLASVVDDLIRKDATSSKLKPFQPELRRYLAGGPVRDPHPTNLHGYEVLERLDGRRSCLTYRCRYSLDDSISIVRLLRPKPLLDEVAADRELDALLNEYRALAKLGPMGATPTVQRPIPLESGQTLVAIAEPDGRSLLDLLEQGPAPEEAEIRRTVYEAFRTLAMVHEQGHLHRAITPERVYVRPDGRVIFTDFHLAHIDGRTGATAVMAELDPLDDEEQVWRARETKRSITTAVEGSDVYALASTLKAWVIGTTNSRELRKHNLNRHLDARERIGSAREPFEELLQTCRAELYKDRPSAAEVAERWAPKTPETRSDEREPNSPTSGSMTEAAAQSQPLCHREMEPGERIDDRFVFRERLGAGRTAVSVLAYDEQSEREVVLKSFDFERVPRELAKREFEALLRLNHDRIAIVRDRYQPDHPYHLVVDHVPGRTAEARLDDFVHDAAAVGAIAHSLLEGLAYLHRHEILHRDISAGNVILGDEQPEQLRIIDFGLASLQHHGADSVGTPLYRAPEVDTGGEWTPACDVYSAGVLLYQLLTGSTPYVVRNGLNKADLLDVPADLPADAERLASLLRTAASFDPDRRFPDGSEFLGAIEDLLTDPDPQRAEPTAEPTIDVEEAASDDRASDGTAEDSIEVASDRADDVPDAPDAFDLDRWLAEITETKPTPPPTPIRPPAVPRPARPVRAPAPAPSPAPPQAVPSTAATSFVAASPTPYGGNAWLAPGRLRRYHVGLDRTIHATIVRGGGERTVRADPIPGLVEAINLGKRAGGQSDGGSFVINEYGHVLVPTSGGVFCVGRLHGVPAFRHGEQLLTASPDGLQPGEVWNGLLAGLRYRLKAGGSDVEYERPDGRLVRLSGVLGPAAARNAVAGFARIKAGGGRLYVNEAGAVTAPMQKRGAWVDVYLGAIDPARWFPAPQVPVR